MQEKEHVFYLRPATGYEGYARCDCREGQADDSPVCFELRFAVYLHFPCNLLESRAHNDSVAVRMTASKSILRMIKFICKIPPSAFNALEGGTL